MPSPFMMAAGIGGILAIALAVAGWQLKVSWQDAGKYQQALTTCTTRLTELNNAHKERDKIDGQNRALSDDALFSGLLK
jgi:glycerol dehydrogenase-like iron-containing ADH family enzyme